MHAELTRKLIQRQELRVPRVLRHRHPDSLEYMQRNRPQPAIPHAKRVHRHVDERATFLLGEIGGTTEFAGSHCVNKTSLWGGIVKRPPAFQAEDHHEFRGWLICAEDLRVVNCSGIGDREMG